MYNRDDQTVSVIGINRGRTQANHETEDYDSVAVRHRRVSAREARKRKKRRKMIRLYTRLAVLISGACLILFLGISFVSMAISAISGIGKDGDGGRQSVNTVGNSGHIASGNSGNHSSGQIGTEDSQGHLSSGNNNNNSGDNSGEESGGQDMPVLAYGDDLYNDGEFVVCIDPGHGGNDVGCIGVDGTYEKDDVLKLADYIVYLLEQEGIKVVRTRSTDAWVNLEDRPAFANEQNADLLVSLHRNVYGSDESVKGFEAWIHSTDSENSEELAKLIMNGLDGVGISKNRGVKKGSQASDDEDYAVNTGSKMPSVLLEMGFMSSPTDNQLYRSNLQAYAQAIVDAIIQWSQGKQY